MASLSADAWRDLRRNWVFWTAGSIVLLMLLLAGFPGLFSSIDPTLTGAVCNLSDSLQGPTSEHWFGFDKQGCDVYAKVVYGARSSVLVGFCSTLIAGVIAIAVGLPAGYYGGWVDGVLARCTDVVLGIPLLLGAVAVALSGRELGIWPVVLALGLMGWPSAARVVRASVISARHQDYVQAARVLGASHTRIMLRHILPNSLAPVVVMLTILLGQFIAFEATLSFLGVGPRNTASWGVSIADAKGWVAESMLPLVFPASFLTATVLAFIMLGDAVRDAFDPKLR
jgi:oligopeptide transport system permease protein